MGEQVHTGAGSTAPDTSSQESSYQVLHDLAYKRTAIANVVFIGPQYGSDWVLVDAGVWGSGGAIIGAAEERFGEGARPSAIVLTHGHFDHVGGLARIAERWQVPIYAHPLELKYLDGHTSYPPPDSNSGGGLMAWLSDLYPRGPVDMRPWLSPLPPDGKLPGLEDWVWLSTPGHTEGHISLWRESDRALIAGDAFITTNQESAYAVALQTPEIHGPPQYFTPDWPSAERSVKRLAELEPETAITGHGKPMTGAGMRRGLHYLAAKFQELAVPRKHEE